MSECKIKYIDNKPVKGKPKLVPKTSKNGFKMFMTAAFIGPPHSGKTHALINLLSRLKDEKAITDIFVISETYYDNPFELLDIPDDHVFTDIENVLDHLKEINEKILDELDLWYGIRNEFSRCRYIKYYALIYKLYKSIKKMSKNTLTYRIY